MWLIYNNAILTKDNLIKRKWVGDERCSFCCEPETISHLLFECTMAKYVWSLVAVALGACCRPTSLEQFWVWTKRYLSEGENFTCRVSQRSAGDFGLQEMTCVLRKKNNLVSYWDHLLSMFVSVILGMVAKGRRPGSTGGGCDSSQERSFELSSARRWRAYWSQAHPIRLKPF